MKPIKDIVAAGAELLRKGELVAFPTETVYGLGADATNDRAVASLYAAKGRPHFNPLISHIAEFDLAYTLGQFNEDAAKLAGAFWPGPLTIVVPKSKTCSVSQLALAGLDTIALRVPAHPIAQALLREMNGPIVAPSANRSGSVSPTLASHVAQSLGERVALIIDGGPCDIGIESTVVACAEGAPVLLRPGGIARSKIEDVLGRRVKSGRKDEVRPQSPGQIAGHYAPRAKVILDVIWPRFDVALLAFGPNAPRHPGPVLNLSIAGDLEEAAANLFAMLHELDASGADTIAVMPIPNQGLGEAINDRLIRAAYPFHR